MSDERSKLDQLAAIRRQKQVAHAHVLGGRRAPPLRLGRPELSASFGDTSRRWEVVVETKSVPWPKTKRVRERLLREVERGLLRIYKKGHLIGTLAHTGTFKQKRTKVATTSNLQFPILPPTFVLLAPGVALRLDPSGPHAGAISFWALVSSGTARAQPTRQDSVRAHSTDGDHREAES